MSVQLFRQLGRRLPQLCVRPASAPLSGPVTTLARVNTRTSRSVSPRATLLGEVRSQPAPRTRPNAGGIGALPLLAAGGGVLSLLLSFWQPAGSGAPPASTQAGGKETEENKGGDGDRLPQYRIADIKSHGPDAERPWVIYEDRVYDITDWIPAHPGGEVIRRAAGGSIEPYWDIFSIHKTAYVRDILEDYLIGRVHPEDLEDGRPRPDHVEDPFASDPARDPRLRAHTTKPYNAETSGDDVADAFLTPNRLFYVRNHMWVPAIEDETAGSHTITVELPDGQDKTYTIAALKARFERHAVTAVMQCSGNRRQDMTKHAAKTHGLQWGVGAISCARWEGVKLRDVLADAGLVVDGPPEDALHVQFSGLEGYGASIPVRTAVDPHGDVLLAFDMNGEPLPRDHGLPVRVIVPGTVAARCVKWVNRIVVSDEESSTTWQRRDYKCFGPNEVRDLDWDRYKAIQEMPVTSAITRTRVKAGTSHTVELRGYAYSGGGREIQRVDVSRDGGETWDQAELLEDSDLELGSKKWCWKRWRYEATVPDGRTEFVVKATDEAYNTQPETHKSIYNLRGNLATAWHRVSYHVSGQKTGGVKGGETRRH